jgi:WhiB family redox-sensing transcriptional regulator
MPRLERATRNPDTTPGKKEDKRHHRAEAMPAPAGFWRPEQDWRLYAACLDDDTELWFRETRADQAEGRSDPAKKVCRDCPVRLQCLAYALQSNERWGIWGGLSTEERDQLARQYATASGNGRGKGRGRQAPPDWGLLL